VGHARRYWLLGRRFNACLGKVRDHADASVELLNPNQFVCHTLPLIGSALRLLPHSLRLLSYPLGFGSYPVQFGHVAAEGHVVCRDQQEGETGRSPNSDEPLQVSLGSDESLEASSSLGDDDECISLHARLLRGHVVTPHGLGFSAHSSPKLCARDHPGRCSARLHAGLRFDLGTRSWIFRR
jgi:hypothetical protein